MYIGHTLHAEHHSTSYLDDFRIYDKALTHDEISVLYNVNQTTYNLLFEQPTECDILIVGGGGGGSGGLGGGGGAGGIAYISNATLQTGTYTISVGNGGIGGIAEQGGGTPGTKGSNSTITHGTTTIIADGGGTPYSGLNNGGSGAGADTYTNDGGVATAGGFIDKSSAPSTFSSGSVNYYGSNGGAKITTSGYASGGGGGAIQAGQNGYGDTGGGNGGWNVCIFLY